MQHNGLDFCTTVRNFVWDCICCQNVTYTMQYTCQPVPHRPSCILPHCRKQTQLELTVNLILGLHTPSATSSEEVCSISLLHENLLQWTCSASRTSLRDKERGRAAEVQLMQLLTLWIFGAACAAGHRCRVGLCGHWVRAQNIMNSLFNNENLASKA